MRANFTKFLWGFFFLLAGALIILNQYCSFTGISIGRIIIATITLAISINCIVKLQFTFLPVPLAVLYIIIQAPFNLPYIREWTLIIAALLASIGLSIIFPHGLWRRYHRKSKCSWQSGQKNSLPTEDSEEINRHVVNVNFAAVSRRLRANSLESARLDCNFGAMEIFLDQANLSPNGAEIFIFCRFGAIELNIPKEWRITDKINCSIGNVEIDKSFFSSSDDAPKVTLTGNVSFGGVEVRPI